MNKNNTLMFSAQRQIILHFCSYCACASSYNAIGFDCPSVHIPDFAHAWYDV